MRPVLLILWVSALSLSACSPRLATPASQPPTSASSPAASTQGHLPNVDWLAYHDDLAGFTIQHPLTWQRQDNGPYPIVFALPAAAGTTLLEKRMEIDVTDQAADCKQSTYTGGGGSTAPQQVTINGMAFLKEAGVGFGLGNVYDWTSYSTVKGAHCITMTFVLHSANPGVYATEPPAFDRAAESAVFGQLLDTFRFDP